MEANVIFVRQVNNDFEYIKIVEAGKPVSQEVIAWTKDYAEEHKINVEWAVDEVPFFAGSAEFVKAMTT
jgi:hypothetical protein